MKGKTLSGMGLIALAAGVLLAIFCVAVTTSRVVLCAGILFALAGAANLIYTARREQTSALGRVLTQVANAAAIILGICLVVFTKTFEPLVVYIFGIFVSVCALWQFFVLAVACRPYQLPVWMYVFPIIVAGFAVAIFICRKSDGSNDADEMLLSGLGIAITGGAAMIEGAQLGRLRRREQGRGVKEETVEDLDAPLQVASSEPEHQENTHLGGEKAEKTVE